MNGINMAYSDFFVLRVLKKVGSNPITYKQIAVSCEITCTPPTVWRALKRLQMNEYIEQVKQTKKGCIYKVLKDMTNAKPQ